MKIAKTSNRDTSYGEENRQKERKDSYQENYGPDTEAQEIRPSNSGKIGTISAGAIEPPEFISPKILKHPNRSISKPKLSPTGLDGTTKLKLNKG